METIKTIRQKMFLTQDELAVYLGISRSFLCKVEMGDKLLPAQAITKLTQLYTTQQQANRHLINKELVQQQNELTDFLQQSTATNNTVKKRLQKKLTQMQDDYNAIMQTLQTIKSIKNNALPDNIKDILWCNAVEAAMLEKLNKNSLVAQKKLELKIASL